MPYKNIEDRNKYYKKWYKKNREKRNEYKRQYYKTNHERINENSRKRCKNNREEVNEYHRQYCKNNYNRIKKYHIKWRKNNPEKLKKIRARYERKRRKNDLKYNLNHKISREIYKSLNGNKHFRKWENLVGYTLDDLMKKLKMTMPKGYNWNDYLEGRLHIDHKIPISAFNFTKPEHIDFKRCWDLSNLKSLPAKENISKGNKLNKPFQPTLLI